MVAQNLSGDLTHLLLVGPGHLDALGLGAGSASRRPLGYAIVGGLLFSTALTLYLVPVVYILLDEARSRVARRAEKLEPVEAEA